MDSLQIPNEAGHYGVNLFANNDIDYDGVVPED